MNGKGSKPRPLSVTQEVYDANWRAVFGKKKPLKPMVATPPRKRTQGLT